MKKSLLLLFFYFCTLSFAAPIHDHTLDPIALRSLATALGIPEDADLVEQTQKSWLRSPTQERWEMAELSPFQKQLVQQWATENGLYEAWTPSLKSYDVALILGATTERMQTRLEYLIKMWKEGIRFNEIVWLTGERPLDSRVDHLSDVCATESSASYILWEKADLPEEMRNLFVTFMNVPMNGSKRPNTEDTLRSWLRFCPKPYTCLFVSDQPFCGYQFATIKANLPTAFPFDVIGKAADPDSHPSAAAITLDTLARWIYTERSFEN
jgi:hypothetical protein